MYMSENKFLSVLKHLIERLKQLAQKKTRLVFYQGFKSVSL